MHCKHITFCWVMFRSELTCLPLNSDFGKRMFQVFYHTLLLSVLILGVNPSGQYHFVSDPGSVLFMSNLVSGLSTVS